MAATIRANDVKASNLYFLSVVFSIPIPFLYPAPGTSVVPTIMILLFAGLLMVALMLGVRMGQHWAKIIFVILAGAGTLLYLTGIPYQNEPIGKTVLYGISAAIQGWAVFIVLKDLLRKSESPNAGAAQGQS